MRFKRKSKCAVCGQDVIIDMDLRTVECGCGKFPQLVKPPQYVLSLMFEPIL